MTEREIIVQYCNEAYADVPNKDERFYQEVSKTLGFAFYNLGVRSNELWAAMKNAFKK